MTREEEAVIHMLRAWDQNPDAVDITIFCSVHNESIRFWRSVVAVLPADFPVLRLWDHGRDTTYVIDRRYDT